MASLEAVRLKTSSAILKAISIFEPGKSFSYESVARRARTQESGQTYTFLTPGMARWEWLLCFVIVCQYASGDVGLSAKKHPPIEDMNASDLGGMFCIALTTAIAAGVLSLRIFVSSF